MHDGDLNESQTLAYKNGRHFVHGFSPFKCNEVDMRR